MSLSLTRVSGVCSGQDAIALILYTDRYFYMYLNVNTNKLQYIHFSE
ncbi:hypothetical protein FDUTEX481_05492 [Tolypothrix sp. PCC 7601]|nr:hypothetical protein FDUTEX481_05492 [Tolypothrix sp. PCC 7601]